MKEENYQILGSVNINYQKCTEIINSYLADARETRLQALIDAIKNNLIIFRYVYATLFPKTYGRTDPQGIKEKLEFEFKYHNWWNEK